MFSRYPRVATQPRGGIEAVTVVLAAALAKIPGVEVHVITLEKEQVRDSVAREGNVRIHRLPASGWPEIADIVCGPGRRRLLEKVKSIAPDILHCHETFGLMLGGLELPIVFTVHGFDHANIPAEGRGLAWLRSPLWKLVERVGLARHRNIISISRYVRGMIAPRTRARIHDIDNPLDERFFEVERREEPGRILFVGWVNERKNTLGAVEAFAMARHLHGCGERLIIAGPAKVPEYLNRVKAMVVREGLEDRVAFLGHIDRVRLSEEYSKASILLLPSLQENAPMAVSEAMAAGIPVVTSNLCGMPYMVKEGKSGFLINPKNAEQIADRIARILKSETLRDKMGRRGREIALERFHPDVVARKTMEVYETVINNTHGSPSNNNWATRGKGHSISANAV